MCVLRETRAVRTSAGRLCGLWNEKTMPLRQAPSATPASAPTKAKAKSDFRPRRSIVTARTASMLLGITSELA